MQRSVSTGFIYHDVFLLRGCFDFPVPPLPLHQLMYQWCLSGILRLFSPPPGSFQLHYFGPERFEFIALFSHFRFIARLTKVTLFRSALSDSFSLWSSVSSAFTATGHPLSRTVHFSAQYKGSVQQSIPVQTCPSLPLYLTQSDLTGRIVWKDRRYQNAAC